MLIDAHGTDIADDVLSLYADVITRTGPLPTLIERDNNVPSFEDLLRETRAVEAILDRFRQQAA
jgi:uncharacterized protein (UPF0276 family)